MEDLAGRLVMAAEVLPLILGTGVVAIAAGMAALVYRARTR